MTTTSGTLAVSQATRSTPLESARTARNLSREELAAAAGVSPRTIYGIELEGVRPHRATRIVLAATLGEHVFRLFPDEPDAVTPRTGASRPDKSEAAPAQDGSAKTPKAVGDDTGS